MKASIISHSIQDNYVIYTIKLNDNIKSWTFSARFSEIAQLHNSILNSKQISILSIPKFPKKKILFSNQTDPVFLMKRRNKLEKFLNEIFQDNIISNLECVQKFIRRAKREYSIFANPEEKKIEEINTRVVILQNDKKEEKKIENTEINLFFNENESNREKIIIEKKSNEKKLIDKAPLPISSKELNDLSSSITKSELMDRVQDRLEKDKNKEIADKYNNELIKVNRSESIQKEVEFRKTQEKYKKKNNFFRNYFGALCGASDD